MNPVYKTIESIDWITLVLFFSMVVLALGKYLFKNKFLNFMILPFNNRYVVLYNKKGRLLSWFHILLTIFQLINFSLFLFLILKVFFTLPSENNPTSFFLLIAGLLLFQIVKMLLQFAQGFVFNTQGLISELLFNKISYLNYSSLVMFISNIVLIYILKDSKIVISSAIILIISINVIGLTRLLKNHQKAIIPYFFYFILYLCALEIAPLVLVGSYLKD
ncbi:DUF4271 domain-containing protein [Flagellimonas aquimarina]|jgi:hypothetical protein|uniref:DUF4271 domain-containing protein n=1 Tax=Flagellimonas aquimarina TaxID=2201895 RepID=A0A316L154_9FLAO|nr:DUF4271 domain-containing protein [Allomuricauda koreensis]PWL40222.1 DUF4271 domain-containing protein [Allomuricauda koreensis]